MCPYDSTEQMAHCKAVCSTVAEDASQRKDCALRRQIAFSSRILVRSADRRHAATRQAKRGAGSNRCKCVLFPGEAGRAAGRTSMKRLAQNQRRTEVENPRSDEQPVTVRSACGLCSKVASLTCPSMTAARDEDRIEVDLFRLCRQQDLFVRVTVTNLPLNKHPQSRGQNMPKSPED